MRTINVIALGISLSVSLSGSTALGHENATGTTSHSSTPASAGANTYGQQKGDLPNFHEVHPFLYRSGAPTEAGMRKLKEMGIKTIIDLRGNPERVFDESKVAHSLGMRSINLPMSSKAPTKDQIEVFMETVEEAQKDKEHGPVLVHCAHGSDRTGCLVGLWRVSHDGWSYDQAYAEMRKYWFTPKFTNLSGIVKQYAEEAKASSPPAK